MSAALSFSDVHKRVRDGVRSRTILDGISFVLQVGEIALLRGPSGAGKSTLLALAGLLDAPTSGEVAIDGAPTSRLRERFRAETRRHKVGFVFQQPILLDDRSALDNVLYPAAPIGIGAAHEQRGRELLGRFGLAELSGTRVARLSGGEQQRVALARALLLQPKVLLCDEPTAHLDTAQSDNFVALLQSLAGSGECAVLVATHDDRLPEALKNARNLRLVAGSSGCTLEEH